MHIHLICRYGYNQLKFHGYIDWRDRGMKNCYFCGDQYTEQYVVMGGAIGSLVIVAFMIPVEMLRYYISTSMTFFRCQKCVYLLCILSLFKI